MKSFLLEERGIMATHFVELYERLAFIIKVLVERKEV